MLERQPRGFWRAGWMTSAELVLDLSRLVLLRVRVTLPPNHARRPAIEVCDGERVVVLEILANVEGRDGRRVEVVDEVLLPLRAE